MKPFLLSALVLFSSWAQAEITLFNAAVFEQKMKAGEGVVVAAHAPWCPTCRAQKPLLKALSMQPEYQALTIYEIDFDSQKTALAGLKINRQSTIVAFKHGKEVSRSIGATSASAIASVLKATE